MSWPELSADTNHSLCGAVDIKSLGSEFVMVAPLVLNPPPVSTEGRGQVTVAPAPLPGGITTVLLKKIRTVSLFGC